MALLQLMMTDMSVHCRLLGRTLVYIVVSKSSSLLSTLELLGNFRLGLLLMQYSLSKEFFGHLNYKGPDLQALYSLLHLAVLI